MDGAVTGKHLLQLSIYLAIEFEVGFSRDNGSTYLEAAIPLLPMGFEFCRCKLSPTRMLDIVVFNISVTIKAYRKAVIELVVSPISSRNNVVELDLCPAVFVAKATVPATRN